MSRVMDQSEVIILRGLPGSGKSRFRTEFMERHSNDAGYCSADDFHYDEHGVYRFNPANAGAAHAACFRKYIGMLEDGITNILVDNTNTSAVEIAPYILGANAWHATVDIFQFDCTLETSMARNVHAVPENIIKTMFSRLKEPLPSWWPKVQVL